jgi:hypothetical protein
MPLASPPDRPEVVYGFGRIDASGRVADRVTVAAPGEDTLTAYSFAVVDQAMRAHAPVPGEGRRP